MKLIALLLCLAASPAWATVLTTTSSGGDCNVGASFVGGVAPNSAGGDQVIIANGATLNVPAMTTCRLGTYPNDDTGAVALQGNGSTGTGILTVQSLGTLWWEGPVRQMNAHWVIHGRLHYDATGAVSPTAALYTWQISGANLQANALLEISGTSTTCSPWNFSGVTPVLTTCAIVDSESNIPSGGFGLGTTLFTDGGRMETSYAHIEYQGAQTTTVNFLKYRMTTSAGRIIFDHTGIDHSGDIFTTAFGAASTFQITNTTITNPTNTAFTIQGDASVAKTTGTRLIQNSVIYGYTNFVGATGASSGFTIQDNEFHATSSTAYFQITKGSSAIWNHNLLYDALTNSTDPQVILPAGTPSNTFVFMHGNPAPGGSNRHPIYTRIASLGVDVVGFVLQYDGTDENSDMFEPGTIDATVLGTPLTVEGSYFLCNSFQNSIGSYMNNSGGGSWPNLRFNFFHNVMCGGGPNLQVYGVGAEKGGTTTVVPAGGWPSIQNNDMWRPGAGPELIANSVVAGVSIVNAVTAADHNNGYLATGSIYGVPSNQFATTPGTGDLAVNPNFVCSTCNFYTADQDVFGNSLGTGWVTAHAYSVGDVISSSDASFYSGATYNFRCLQAHTSGATTKPGSGTTPSSVWADYWAPATQNDVEQATVAGTLFGGLSAAGATVKYVQDSFKFRNSALHNVGSDGLDIGPVGSYSPPAPVSIALTPNPVTVAVGGTQTYVCTTTLSDTTTRNCISPVLVSSDPTKLSISGLVGTGVASGTGTVTATAESLTSPTDPFTVTSIVPTAYLSPGLAISSGVSIK